MDQGTLYDTDKAFWHGFIDYYEPFLQQLSEPSHILEFGVFRGHSIRWLLKRFPTAHLCGVDILPESADWPKDERVHYVRLDQGETSQIQALFAEPTEYDLIIEDGSHQPMHQARCLVEGMRRVRAGGLYILEDIHTCHPRHSYYASLVARARRAVVSPLQLLLGLEHLKRSRAGATRESLAQLAQSSLFSLSEVTELNGAIAEIHVYKRSVLPQRCWRCGGEKFNYASLTCACGESLYLAEDSMSVVLRKTAN